MLPAIKGRREVFLSRDLSLAPLLTRRRNDHRFIGDSLKIPACCVEFYLVQSEQAAEEGFDYSGLIRIPKSLEAPLLSNTLARYFDRGIVDHFPCCYDCRKTGVVARQLMGVLRSVDKTLAAKLVARGRFYLFDEIKASFVLARFFKKREGRLSVEGGDHEPRQELGETTKGGQ